MAILVDSVSEPIFDPLAGDRLKLVRFVAPHYEAARPIVLADLTTTERHIAEGGSPQLAPAERDRGNIRLDVPWAGEFPTFDRHGNARLSFTLRLMASDAVIDADAVVATILTAPSRCAIEWRRGGRPTYFPLRGDADWTPAYSMSDRRQGGGMTVAFNIEVAPWSHHGSMDITDDFAVDSLADYTFDAGAGTLSVSSGQLVPADTAEKRLYHSARGFDYGDVQATVKATTGATLPTAIGVSLVRLDASNTLFVWFRGAANQLRISKFDGGVETVLASAAATVTTNTTYWIRGRREGNTLLAELFTAQPTPMGAPTTTVSHVLAGADATKFGSGALGDVGIRWLPAGTDERLDDFRVAPFTYRNISSPEHVTMRGAIPGDIPALCDLYVSNVEGGTNAPIFGLFGWSSRPVGSAPLGILEGEAATTLTTFVVANWAGVAHDDSYAGASPSGAGTALVQWLVDSNALVPDEDGTVSVEVFARVIYDNTRTGLKWVLHADPASGISRGSRRYGNLGTAGVTSVAVTAQAWRFIRLGRIRLGGSQRLGVDVSWSAGTGPVGLDYALVVPSRLFAASPMGVANDDAYPDLFPSASVEVTRILHHDGSGHSRVEGQSALRDHGLGRRIELPTGEVDLIMKLSNLVPADPTVNALSEQLKNFATLHARLTPRYVYA